MREPGGIWYNAKGKIQGCLNLQGQGFARFKQLWEFSSDSTIAKGQELLSI